MYHGGSSSNGSTTYPFVGVPIDYPTKLDDNTRVANRHTVSPPDSEISRNKTSTAARISVHFASGAAWQRGTAQPAPEIGGGEKYSKGHRQLDQGHLKKTARSAIRTASEVTDTTKKQVRVDRMSRAKPPKAPGGDSATQGPRPWSPDCSSYHPEDSSQATVGALQRALKAQVLQSLEVLREIAKKFRAFNLGLETIDDWVAEIKEVDETLIPVPSSSTVQLLVPFEKLNFILTKCITASGPMRDFIVRDQALELLKYIQTYAEEYHLFKNQRAHLD
ncbi:hypothetical protein PENNAL_c0724G05174, partial [Penicillium nalgiovense]